MINKAIKINIGLINPNSGIISGVVSASKSMNNAVSSNSFSDSKIFYYYQKLKYSLNSFYGQSNFCECVHFYFL